MVTATRKYFSIVSETCNNTQDIIGSKLIEITEVDELSRNVDLEGELL